MTLKWLNVLLFALGLAGLGWMLHHVGLGRVWRDLASLGWGMLPLALIEGAGEVFHTEGWRRCMSGTGRRQPFLRLFWIRIAGSSVNYFTPTAALGGEVSRASLVALPGEGPHAVGSVLLDKATMASAHLILVVVGALAVMGDVKLPATLWSAMIASGGLLFAGVFTFMLLQARGQLGAVIRWLRRRLGGRIPRNLAEDSADVDEVLRGLYRRRRADIAVSTFWHMAGFLAGAGQLWLYLSLAKQPTPFPGVAAAWVLGLWFDLLVFMVPMGLGTLEGSRIAAFAAAGFRGAGGMAYGVALRIAQLSWAILGLCAYAVLVSHSARRTRTARLPLP